MLWKRTTEEVGTRRLLAVGSLVFVIGTTVNLAWISQRTLWIDESATVNAATRSFAAMTELTHHLDLVHRAYYTVMHFWFDVVGYSPVTLRAPSAVAVAAAAALLVALGARLVGLRYGVFAAAVLMATPSVLMSGTNGRSQAFQVFLAVAASLVLTILIRGGAQRPRGRAVAWWLLYAAIAYAGILTNLWFVFLVAAHGLSILIACVGRRRAPLRLAVAGAATTVLVVAAAIPFALAAAAQRAQVGWVHPASPGDALTIFVRDMPFATLVVRQNALWVDVTACVFWASALLGMAWFARRDPRQLGLVVPWLLIPAIGLFAVSAATSPTFLDRYLIPSAPALALLVAAGMEAFASRGRRVLAGAGLVAVLVLGTYNWHHLRWGTTRFVDFAAAARTISADRAAHPDRRTGVVQGVLARTTVQLFLDYRAQLTGVADLSRTPPRPPDRLWPVLPDVTDALDRARAYDVVWYVGPDGGPRTARVARDLRARGFASTGVVHLAGVETPELGGAVLIKFQK